MGMIERMRAGMLAAARLVRMGEFAEATAAIQQAFREDGPIGDEIPPVSPPPAAPTPKPVPDADLGGKFLSGSYSNHAGARDYKLYIPGSYHGQTLPLIVMLHGCVQTPDDFAAGTRMNACAEQQPCFVLYPAQTPNAHRHNCWNWFMTTNQQRDQGEPSIIAGITRQIINSYSIDKQRVYVAGLSAGGAMAVVMAMTYPDLYAAIGVHSGLPYGAAYDLPSALAVMQGATMPGNQQHKNADSYRRVVPAIVFHGDRDTTVHPRNGEQVIAQWSAIHIRHATSSGTGKKPRVKTHRSQVVDGHSYSHSTYHDITGRTILEQWQIHGAGHAWSGGSPNGSYTDPQGPDATREMLRFFHEHPYLETDAV